MQLVHGLLKDCGRYVFIAFVHDKDLDVPSAQREAFDPRRFVAAQESSQRLATSETEVRLHDLLFGHNLDGALDLEPMSCRQLFVHR